MSVGFFSESISLSAHASVKKRLLLNFAPSHILNEEVYPGLDPGRFRCYAPQRAFPFLFRFMEPCPQTRVLLMLQEQ